MRKLVFTFMTLITLSGGSVLAATDLAAKVHTGKAEIKMLAKDKRLTEITQSNDQKYFAYMPRPEWLVVGSGSGDINLEVHLPRIKAISDLSWSQDSRYLTFTAKDRELWLFDRQHAAIKLLEAVPASHPNVQYLPQWSGKTPWLLFVSHKNNQSRPRIYSPQKKHSYALPLSISEVSAIAWADKSKVIKVSDFVGEAQRIASFNAFGITIEQAESQKLAWLNK